MVKNGLVLGAIPLVLFVFPLLFGAVGWAVARTWWGAVIGVAFGCALLFGTAAWIAAHWNHG